MHHSGLGSFRDTVLHHAMKHYSNKRAIPLGTLIFCLGFVGCASDTASIDPNPASEQRAALAFPYPTVGVAVPRGTEPRSDEAIVALIESRFHLHRRLAELPIHVVAVGGDVLLLGVVPTDVEKVLAGRFALDTAGVERVDNQLSILPLERSSEAAPTVRSDAALVDDAQMALKLSRALADSAITVTVRRGVARLAGVVSSEGDRVYVDEIVGGVPGIRWVRNGLLVQSGSN